LMRYNSRRTKAMSISSVLNFLFVGSAFAVVASLGGDAVAFGDHNANSGSDTVTRRPRAEVKIGRSLIVDPNLVVNDIDNSEIDMQPTLPFGDINILVVSDVHSHVGGHPHEPNRNADYGDLYSFHQLLEAYLEIIPLGDLYLFNNGDILHGTGLAMDGNATNLLPIVNAMPWDSLTMGRQEAAYSDVLRDMSESTLPAFPGKYITSNVVWNETKKPYGDRYQLLKGKNSTILVVGFLFDTVGHSETIDVLSIQETTQQEWFRDVLQDEHYDAIVVMAHMDNFSPLIDDIYQEIREHVDPQMPIQFITGHSHKRELANIMQKDHYVHRIEPGGLFDTIGWVNIPKFDTAKKFPKKGRSDELDEVFRQEFLNASKTVLHTRLGLDEDQELRTTDGNTISEMIHDTQERLGLNQIVACPGHDYYRNISIHETNSLWKLWREHVVRTEIFKKNEDRIMMVSKSSFRYDLIGVGKHDAMTLDDVVAIAPYMEKVVYVGDVPDWMIRRMNTTFNSFSAHNIIPDYVLAGDMDSFRTAESYQLYTHEADVPKIKTKLEKFNFQDFDLKYTGQRDTLYWLDYLQNAFPCKGVDKEKGKFVEPYFFDPNELEEEATDGKLTSGDLDTDDDGEEEGGGNADNEITWTLPPNEEYMGYIPKKQPGTNIPVSVYEDYKSKEEIEKIEKEEKTSQKDHYRKKDSKSQMKERKKTHRKIIKGFTLLFAGGLLLIPVVCLVLQVIGRSTYNDDYEESGGAGLYDRQEMKLLKRHRRRGTKPTGKLLRSAPFGEIEIL